MADKKTTTTPTEPKAVTSKTEGADLLQSIPNSLPSQVDQYWTPDHLKKIYPVTELQIEPDEYSDRELSHPRGQWRPRSLKMRDYLDDFQNTLLSSSKLFPDDYLILNDITMTGIPETSITIKNRSGTFVAETIRSDHPIVVPQCNQEVSIDISLIFRPTEDSFNKLHRLIGEVSNFPLVYIYNNKIRKSIGFSPDITMIFILENGTIRNSPDAVGSILVDLSLHLFNYRPFSNHFWYNTILPGVTNRSASGIESYVSRALNQPQTDLTGYEASDYAIDRETKKFLDEVKSPELWIGSWDEAANIPSPLPALSDPWMEYANKLEGLIPWIKIDKDDDFVGFEMRDYVVMNQPGVSKEVQDEVRRTVNGDLDFPETDPLYHRKTWLTETFKKTASVRRLDAAAGEAEKKKAARAEKLTEILGKERDERYARLKSYGGQIYKAAVEAYDNNPHNIYPGQILKFKPALYKFGDSGHILSLTDLDVYWLAKSLVGEGFKSQDKTTRKGVIVGWTIINRHFTTYYEREHKTKGLERLYQEGWKFYHSVRVFSQPVNPAWYPGGYKWEKKRAIGAESASNAKSYRRIGILEKEYMKLPVEARRIAEGFAYGSWKYPHEFVNRGERINDFASGGFSKEEKKNALAIKNTRGVPEYFVYTPPNPAPKNVKGIVEIIVAGGGPRVLTDEEKAEKKEILQRINSPASQEQLKKEAAAEARRLQNLHNKNQSESVPDEIDELLKPEQSIDEELVKEQKKRDAAGVNKTFSQTVKLKKAEARRKKDKQEWIKDVKAEGISYYDEDPSVKNVFYTTERINISSDPAVQNINLVSGDPEVQKANIQDWSQEIFSFPNIVCSGVSLNFGHRIAPLKLTGQDSYTYQFLGAGNKSGVLVFTYAGRAGRTSADKLKQLFLRARNSAAKLQGLIPTAGAIKIIKTLPSSGNTQEKRNNILSLLNIDNIVITDFEEVNSPEGPDKYQLVVSFINQEFTEEKLQSTFSVNTATKKKIISILAKKIKGSLIRKAEISKSFDWEKTMGTGINSSHRSTHRSVKAALWKYEKVELRAPRYIRHLYEKNRDYRTPEWMAEAILTVYHASLRANRDMPPSNWKLDKRSNMTWKDRYAEFGAGHLMFGYIDNIDSQELGFEQIPRNYEGNLDEKIDHDAAKEYVRRSDRLGASSFSRGIVVSQNYATINDAYNRNHFDFNGGLETNQTHYTVFGQWLEQMELAYQIVMKHIYKDRINFNLIFGENTSDKIIKQVTERLGECYDDLKLPRFTGTEIPVPPEFFVYDDSNEDPIIGELTDPRNLEKQLAKHIRTTKRSINNFLVENLLGGSYMSENMAAILQERAQDMTNYYGLNETGDLTDRGGEIEYHLTGQFLAAGCSTWDPVLYNSELENQINNLKKDSGEYSWIKNIYEKYGNTPDKRSLKFIDNAIKLNSHLYGGKSNSWQQVSGFNDSANVPFTTAGDKYSFGFPPNVKLAEQIYQKGYKDLKFGPNLNYSGADAAIAGIPTVVAEQIGEGKSQANRKIITKLAPGESVRSVTIQKDGKDKKVNCLTKADGDMVCSNSSNWIPISDSVVVIEDSTRDRDVSVDIDTIKRTPKASDSQLGTIAKYAAIGGAAAWTAGAAVIYGAYSLTPPGIATNLLLLGSATLLASAAVPTAALVAPTAGALYLGAKSIFSAVDSVRGKKEAPEDVPDDKIAKKITKAKAVAEIARSKFNSTEKAEESMAKMAAGIAIGSKAGDLNIRRVFPTFKIYFIEDDSGESFTSDTKVVRAFDDFYSYSAIQEIKITRSRKVAADLAIIRMTNVGGRIFRRRFLDGKDDENLGVKGASGEVYGIGAEYAAGWLAETELENPFQKLVLQDGVKVQIRLGYASNPEHLESVFLGQIVEIMPKEEGKIIELICQGYGAELEAVELGPLEDGPVYYSSQQALSTVMVQTSNISNFGRQERHPRATPAEARNRFLHKPGHGMLANANPVQWIKNWGENQAFKLYAEHQFLNEPQDDNIYAPPPTVYASTWMRFWNNACIYRPIHQTPWEIFKEHELRHPGYIASAVPYGHEPRMTMFFGPKGQHYWKHPPSQLELNMATSLQEGIVNLRGLDAQQIRETRGAFIRKMIDLSKQHPKLARAIIEDTVHFAAPVGSGKALGEIFNRYVPFRNYLYKDSAHHILKNEIRTSRSDVYNKIEVRYFADEDKIQGDDNILSLFSGAPLVGKYFTDSAKRTSSYIKELSDGGAAIEACKLDDNIPDEDIRSLVKSFPSCVTIDMAKRYIQGLFARHLRDAYKGELIVLGDERIKPYDIIQLNDSSINMIGPIEVEAVTHIFNRENGFCSIVTPDLCVDINDYYSLTTFDIANAAYGLTYAGTTANIAGLTFGGGLAGTAAIALGSFAIASPAAVATAAATAGIGLGYLATVGAVKLMRWTQDGVPVTITPLTFQGKPFTSVSVDSGNAGLFTTFMGQWNQWWDDLDTARTRANLLEEAAILMLNTKKGIFNFVAGDPGSPPANK